MPLTLRDRVLNWLSSPGVLRPTFTFLRSVCPIFVFRKRAVITRHADVIEILTRDTEFTIAEINAANFAALDVPFILGMDRSPQYDRDAGILREVVRADDLVRIRKFISERAASIVEAARPNGRIDVVGDLVRVVPVRLIDSYFGFPAPDDATMMRWMRDIFHDLFVNATTDARVHSDAVRSSTGLREHMDNVIARRKSLAGEPNQPDDVLGRLLALQDDAHAWLDDLAVRHNLAGVILGAVDTTSKFVALAIDELLRRPSALAEARAAALAGDIELVRKYAYEAVRFNPHGPGQARFCAQGAQVAAGTSRAKRIPPGTTIFVATLSAMFDPDVFDQPSRFRVDRDLEYLHFGFGMHRCFGKAINDVQIPELLASLLRLPNLRRAKGHAGCIEYDGPFPDHLILEFDPDDESRAGEPGR